MASEDGLMIEKKSRYRVLVVEDNPGFMVNALKALTAHEVLPATNLEEVLHLERLKLDFILSDVHFPDERGGQPVENIVPLMHAALEANVPICFVTQADHHGLTESNEGFISIKPVIVSDLVQTLMELTGKNADKEKKAFSSVKSKNPLTVRSDSKTSEIWATAFQALQNACARSNGPLESAIRQIKSAGLSVGVENGLPNVRAPR